MWLSCSVDGLESQKRSESSGLLIVIGRIKEIGAVEGVWSEDRIEMDYHHGPRRWSCNHSESSLNAREPMKDIYDVLFSLNILWVY